MQLQLNCSTVFSLYLASTENLASLLCHMNIITSLNPEQSCFFASKELAHCYFLIAKNDYS